MGLLSPKKLSKASPKRTKKSKKSVEKNTQPCKQCQEQYFKKYSVSIKKQLTFFQLQAQQIKTILKEGSCQIKNCVPGCDDAHLTPYEQYINMLKDERKQFEKVLQIIGQAKTDEKVLGELSLNQIEKREKNQQGVTLQTPSQQITNQRAKIVEEMILIVGMKLKQKSSTIHLAVKIFDFVSITQNGFDNPKNETKNLRFLAAQCLLLASKFIEVQRIYPAELVYQVKGWSEKEYTLLKQGTVEEYILNILGFDLIFLTPAEFITFFCAAWKVSPCASCLKCGQISAQMSNSSAQKVEFVAQELCKNIVAQLGHAISVKYLPSQVAAVSLQLAKKIVLEEEIRTPRGEIDRVSQYLDETMRILGQDHESVQELMDEINGNAMLTEYISQGEKRVQKVNVVENISPSKRRGYNHHGLRRKDGISQENLKKFDRFFRENFEFDAPSQIYPPYQMTTFEHSLKVTHDFFGGHYRNNQNQVDAAPSLLPQSQILNVEKLHYNSHLIQPVTKFNKLSENQEKKRDKENQKQTIGIPKVREFMQEKELGLDLKLISTQEESMEPQQFFFQKENSFRSDNISAEGMSQRQSKYRLNDGVESDCSESMITYFNQIKLEEQQKLEAIQAKYGACKEIEVQPNYRPLRIKKLPAPEQAWMSPPSHKNLASPY